MQRRLRRGELNCGNDAPCHYRKCGENVWPCAPQYVGEHSAIGESRCVYAAIVYSELRAHRLQNSIEKFQITLAVSPCLINPAETFGINGRVCRKSLRV